MIELWPIFHRGKCYLYYVTNYRHVWDITANNYYRLIWISNNISSTRNCYSAPPFDANLPSTSFSLCGTILSISTSSGLHIDNRTWESNSIHPLQNLGQTSLTTFIMACRKYKLTLVFKSFLMFLIFSFW